MTVRREEGEILNLLGIAILALPVWVVVDAINRHGWIGGVVATVLVAVALKLFTM